MIARHWRGCIKTENAETYENFLKQKVLPGLAGIEGYSGGYVLRRDAGPEAEFLVINFFEPLEVVKRFAGPEYTIPVFEPEARALLSRIEDFATHYKVRACTVPGVAGPRPRS